MVRLREWPDGAALVAALVQQVVGRLKEDLARQDQVALVVSGGQSPVPFFQALSAQALEWSRVAITLADERWVPPDDADSNEALVRAHLLKGPAAVARMVPFWNGAESPEAAVPEVGLALAALPRPFSEVILGMGEDGHVASLFPGAAELQKGLETGAQILAVHPPSAPHARLSLSLQALLDSRDIVLLISGPGKRATLERALGKGPVEDLPVRAVLRQKAVPVAIFWAP